MKSVSRFTHYPCGLLAALLLVCTPAMDAAQQPNVLLIMTDDQGWGDVRSHGNDQIDTPNHDRIASEGARFDRFFVSPVCAPTRASLLTGRYHLRGGVHNVTRGEETMRASEVTLAEVFKANGYATGAFGKWHNGAHYPQHPLGQGFDEFLGFCAGHWNLYFDTPLEHNGEPVKGKGFIIDHLTDATMDFIRKNRSQPWFAFVPYNTPHSPFQVPEKYFKKHKDRGLDDELACVYGMVENIDDNLGRLLKLLTDLRLANNTIVIFLTDNGANTDRYNDGMKGRKGSLHEGGSRVPFFLRWPGHIKPGTVVKPIAMHIDVLPTLVELCGLKKVQTPPLDGRSLVPLLKGDPTDWPQRTLFTQWGGNLEKVNRGAVRTDRWRLVKERGDWELYDMPADPGQARNVAAAHPEVMKELSIAFDAWWKDVTEDGFAPIPTEIGHPQAPQVTLPGHEALLQPALGEGISYFGRNGWANDWVDNWTSTNSFPAWPVDIVRAGNYEISFQYACQPADVGACLRVEVGGKTLEGVVSQPHAAPAIPAADLVGRKEAPERQWATMSLGTMPLPKGLTRLEVKALSKPGKKVIELKAVQVKRVD